MGIPQGKPLKQKAAATATDAAVAPTTSNKTHNNHNSSKMITNSVATTHSPATRCQLAGKEIIFRHKEPEGP